MPSFGVMAAMSSPTLGVGLQTHLARMQPVQLHPIPNVALHNAEHLREQPAPALAAQPFFAGMRASLSARTISRVISNSMVCG